MTKSSNRDTLAHTQSLPLPADKRPLITVIIPAFNAAATIKGCLTALQRQTLDPSLYEVIVVDDGSDDETAAIVMEMGVKLLQKNRGRPAAARNSGVAVAQGHFIAFTDADCEPLPTWLDALTHPLRVNPAIIASKGVYLTRQTRIVARFVQLEYEEKYARLATRDRIDFVDTYSAGFRKDIFVANGGFDEQFPNSEDRELAHRLAARGYEMVFAPAAVVYHLHSDTFLKYFRKKTQNGYWVSQVLRRFPAQSINDSHSPQSMKIQIGLVGLLLATFAAATVGTLWFNGTLFYLPLLCFLLFLLTTIPFVQQAWHKDRSVALAAPFLLATRGLALGLGYTWALIERRDGITDVESTIGGVRYVIKRIADILVGLAGVCLFLLIWPIMKLLLWNRPIFQQQTFVGQQGRPFHQKRFNLKPSHTLWRRLRVDRLPAAWNLLRGNMSLIGPAPSTPDVVATFADWERRRLSIKPGLTGPVQIDATLRNDREAAARLELAYIDNYSLTNDWRLLVAAIRQWPRPHATDDA